MTIQRYSLYNPSFGTDALANLESDESGEIVLWNDIKHLIEWKTLSPECRPIDELHTYFWVKGKDNNPMIGYLMYDGPFDDDADGEWYLYDGGEGIYSIPDVFNSDEKVKWKPLDSDPWNKS